MFWSSWILNICVLYWPCIFTLQVRDMQQGGPLELWVRKEDHECGCPKIRPRSTYLILGNDSDKRRAIIVEKDTIVLEWKEEWRRRMKRFQRRSRKYCPEVWKLKKVRKKAFLAMSVTLVTITDGQMDFHSTICGDKIFMAWLKITNQNARPAICVWQFIVIRLKILCHMKLLLNFRTCKDSAKPRKCYSCMDFYTQKTQSIIQCPCWRGKLFLLTKPLELISICSYWCQNHFD